MKMNISAAILAVAITLIVQCLTPAWAADIIKHPSGRYLQDAAGKPLFLLGYHNWASVVDGYFIDHPSNYRTMMTQGQLYNLNYIRVSLGCNRMTASTNPPSWNGVPLPVPFLYVNGKADLDQWDPVFWNGLKAQCEFARQKGFYIHLAIFDGVDIRGGSQSYRYANSFWKPSNQTRSFYPDPDLNGNGNIDESNEFYQITAFNNNTGIGYYQRKLIDKVIAETSAYDNVFYEIGNELLSSSADWNTAVITYIKGKTGKAVTQNGGSKAANLDAWAQHAANTPAEVKANVGSMAGLGYPVWEDPDGPALINGSADDLRRSAWYSFTGGAAGWGGFTTDFWSEGSGFNTTKGTYYKNLMDFINVSGVRFWEMTPQHSLVSNSSGNSCLAKTGSYYIAYVLSDSYVILDLSAVSGDTVYRLYDPRTGVWSDQKTVAGGGTRIFIKPPGWNDWVVLVGVTFTLPDWNTLGQQHQVAEGATPGIAVDSQGKIHLVYMSGGSIYYRTGNSDGAFGPVEIIPSPEGSANYNSPHVVTDINDVPHVVFERDWAGSSKKAWYTNRIGGSWKTPVLAIHNADDRVNYPRLAIRGPYAFVAGFGASPPEQGNCGTVVRLSNLAGTPKLDMTVYTPLWVPYPIFDYTGRLFLIGRNGPAGHYMQEYNINLNPVGSFDKVNSGTYGKTSEVSAVGVDLGNVIHIVSSGVANAAGDDEMWYNNTARLSQGQGVITGLHIPGSSWGEECYPHMVVDALGRPYIAYRDPVTGQGKMTVIYDNQFQPPVVFGDSIPHRLRWNAQVAPAPEGGVFVVWDSGGLVYMRSVGVGPRTPDTTPPGPVTGFSAVSGNQKVTLSWTNPGDSDFTGTLIVYKTSGYPTSPTDGAVVVDKEASPGSSGSFVHTGLTGGITCYYRAFAYDRSQNYNTANVTASATPVSVPLATISTSAFDTGTDGWNIITWKSGAHEPGVMQWNGSAGRTGGGMRCNGSGTTDNDDRCNREGGEIRKIISTSGYSNIEISYDLRVDVLGNAVTGTGTGTCTVDHNMIDEQLTVYYSTNFGINWTEAECITRNELLDYQSYGTRIIDLSGITAAANNPAFALRFRWQINTATDTVDLDNIVIKGTAAEASIPQVKSLGNNQVRCLRGKIVTAVYNGYFYIQEPDRTSGIKVISNQSVQVGDIVDLVGTIKGSGSERFIDCGSNPVIVKCGLLPMAGVGR